MRHISAPVRPAVARRLSVGARVLGLAMLAAGCAMEPDTSLIEAVSNPRRAPVTPSLPAYPVAVANPSVAGVNTAMPGDPAQPAVSAVLDDAERERTIAEMSAMAGRGQVRKPLSSPSELRRLQNGHGAAALADIEGR
ncbi:MAG: hypothetical protein ACK4K8_00890 [Pannonibacter sp.]